MMPADRPWQAGAGLLGLFASTFFRPFLTPVPLIKERSSVGCVQAQHSLVQLASKVILDGGVSLAGPQEDLHGASGYCYSDFELRMGGRGKDYRVLYQQTNKQTNMVMTLLELHYILLVQVFCVRQDDGGGVNLGPGN